MTAGLSHENYVPNQYVITLKKGTDIKKHLEQVEGIIRSTADCNKDIKSAVSTNSFMSKVLIYGILLNPTGIVELRKNKEIEKIVEDVYVEMDSQTVSRNISKRLTNRLTHQSVQNAPWYSSLRTKNLIFLTVIIQEPPSIKHEKKWVGRN